MGAIVNKTVARLQVLRQSNGAIVNKTLARLQVPRQRNGAIVNKTVARLQVLRENRIEEQVSLGCAAIVLTPNDENERVRRATF